MCAECALRHRRELLDPLRQLVDELEQRCLRIYQHRYEHALRVRLFGYGGPAELASNLRIEHDEAGLPLLVPAPLMSGLNDRDLGPPVLSEVMRAVMQDRAAAKASDRRDDDDDGLDLRIECDELHVGLRLCRYLLFASGPTGGPSTHPTRTTTTRKRLFTRRT